MTDSIEDNAGVQLADGTTYRLAYLSPGQYELFRLEHDRLGYPYWHGLGAIRPHTDSEADLREAVALARGFFDPDDA